MGGGGYEWWIKQHKGHAIRLPDCTVTILGGGPHLRYPAYTAPRHPQPFVTCRIDGTIISASGGVLTNRTALLEWDFVVELVYEGRHHGIVYADCPECEIEAMIFYEGDYICAWCREHLEDGHSYYGRD